jgi:hypothetical protein
MATREDRSPAFKLDQETSQVSRRELLALLAIFGIAGGRDASAQDASKVNPRAYRIAFENERLRVLEYRSRPGLGVCGQGKHSHPAHLSMLSTDAKVKVTLEDGKFVVAEGKAGEMFWSPAEVHTTENISGHAVRSYIIEIKDKDWKPSTG